MADRDKLAKAMTGAPFPSKRTLSKIDAILASIQQQGYAIAPREPTEAMVRHAQKQDGYHLHETYARAIWGWMLAAAEEGQ